MDALYSEIINNKEKEQPLDNNLWYYLADKGQHIPNAIGTTAGFYKNFQDMNNTPKIDKKDKYFHAKANFNAGQNKDLGTAVTLDLLKEAFDIPYKTWIKKNGHSFKENINDSRQDLEADFYGLYQGFTHPHGKPQIYLQNIRPGELDERY